MDICMVLVEVNSIIKIHIEGISIKEECKVQVYILNTRIKNGSLGISKIIHCPKNLKKDNINLINLHFLTLGFLKINTKNWLTKKITTWTFSLQKTKFKHQSKEEESQVEIPTLKIILCSKKVERKH